jgi:ketosteroid isomerase-like protein
VSENADVVRRYFDAANRGDFASAMALYSPDVVLVVPDSLMPKQAGTIDGQKAVGEWFDDWFRSFARGYRFEIEEILAAGERVVATARHRGRGRASEAPLDWSLAYVFTIRGTEIVRLEIYGELGAALEAAGLEPQRP